MKILNIFLMLFLLMTNSFAATTTVSTGTRRLTNEEISRFYSSVNVGQQLSVTLKDGRKLSGKVTEKFPVENKFTLKVNKTLYGLSATTYSNTSSSVGTSNERFFLHVLLELLLSTQTTGMCDCVCYMGSGGPRMCNQPANACGC